MASELIYTTPYESDNPTEVSLREAFQTLYTQLDPPFPLTVPTPAEYTNLNKAILYAILTQPQPEKSRTHIKHLHAIVTDGYTLFTFLTTTVVNELYRKLMETAKRQLIWTTYELVNVLAEGFSGLLIAILRRIENGDFGEGNLWLCEKMVVLFAERWDCLVENEPGVVSCGLYVFLRLLADHYRVVLPSPSNMKMEELKQKEIKFCVRVIRENFALCLMIGRDFVRLLQDLVHVPEFRAIWRDLLMNPGEFRVDGFLDISQLYCVRTPSRFFLLRVGQEMEAQLRFLLTNVKLGSQKRYQVWFVKKFLCVPEREGVLVDIVRFVCCAHYPSNEILQSDIIPRWAVIGWLLKCCTKNYVEANMKLALFYNWLFFNENSDNVMNIEPAMLLMVNSIPKYVDITSALLEFLLILVDNYDIERKDLLVKGVSAALSVLVKKGVVPSLDALIRSDMLAPFLKDGLGKLSVLNKPISIPRELQPSNLPSSSSLELESPTWFQGDQRMSYSPEGGLNTERISVSS